MVWCEQSRIEHTKPLLWCISVELDSERHVSHNYAHMINFDFAFFWHHDLLYSAVLLSLMSSKYAAPSHTSFKYWTPTSRNAVHSKPSTFDSWMNGRMNRQPHSRLPQIHGVQCFDPPSEPQQPSSEVIRRSDQSIVAVQDDCLRLWRYVKARHLLALFNNIGD